MRCLYCRQPLPHTPINAGKPWTPALDATMERQVALYRKRGVPVEDALPLLAELFGRTEAGILTRLLKLDLITP